MLARVTAVPDDETLSLFGPLHDASGVLGGFGHAALVALLAVRLGPRRGRIKQALAATGQRSLSCYLMQSVAWAILYTPYRLDLSDELDVAVNALLGVAVWAGTVVLADQMRRCSYRGPFEILLRRATYGIT